MARTIQEVFNSFVQPVERELELATATNACEASFYAQTDRVTNKWHHYLGVYDRHLGRSRDQPVRLLEIGIREGGSLQMWRRYLGPRAIIHGIDVDPSCAEIDDLDVTITVGSQADGAVLHDVVQKMGGLDVVIDDGSHFWSHQIATFEFLYPLLSETGVYICEDTHTSYWPGFEGQPPAGESFIAFAKRLIDDLHVWYQLERGAADGEAFARRTRSINIYDSMVVFEKEVRPRPRNCTFGSRFLSRGG
jgi:hypothetical protein